MTTEHTTHNELDRREFIRRASAAAVAGLGAPYVWAQRTDETLVVNSFGGEYQELFEKAVIQPFEKKFGVKVVHDATGTSSQDYAKIRASKGAPGFDVAAALSPPEVMLGAKEGLLEKITEKEVPNLKFTWEKARQTLPPVAVMHTLQFDSLLYNKDKLDKPGVLGGLLATRKALRREGEGAHHQLQPRQPAVGVRADSRGRTGRRQRDRTWTRRGRCSRARSPTWASSSRLPRKPRRISRAAKSGCRRIGARVRATTSAAAFPTA